VHHDLGDLVSDGAGDGHVGFLDRLA